MTIKHLLFYIIGGTSSETLKVARNDPSNLKTERRTLQDILVIVFNRLLAISFSEGLDTFCERLYRI